MGPIRGRGVYNWLPDMSNKACYDSGTGPNPTH